MAEEINMNDDEELEETTEENHEEHDHDSDHKHNKKKWYKSAWFWIVLVAIIVLAGALIWFVTVYRPAQNEQQQQTDAERDLNSDWEAIVEEADEFTTKVGDAASIEDFNGLGSDADKVLDALSSAEDRFKEDNRIDNGAYQEALESVTTYLLSLQAVLQKDFEKITASDFDDLKELSDQSLDSVNEFQDETEYVDENISTSFFDTYTDAKVLYEAKVEELKKADEEAQKAEEEAEKALASEEQAVSDAVDGFTEAFIEGDLDAIKKFMTTNFQEEFDYTSRQNDYYIPVSFRTIDKVKDNESRYYVYGRMTQKLADGEDQYSYDYNFTVVKDGTKWLVDLDQAPTR